MNTTKIGILLTAIAGWVTAQALAPNSYGEPAQERGEREPGRPSPDGGPGGPPPPPPPRPPVNRLFMAIDNDLDGELSAKEIANASEAILRLDRNKDGILTEEEVRPPQPHRGPEGRPEGGPGEGRPEGRPGRPGRPEGGPGRFGDPGEGGPGPQANPKAFADSILQFDKDGDGKVTVKELPDRRGHLIEEGDLDGDDALDRSEIETLSRRPPPRHPGGGPPPPGHPGPDRP